MSQYHSQLVLLHRFSPAFFTFTAKLVHCITPLYAPPTTSYMKKLQELVAVINRNKTKSISIIGGGKTTKLDRLYHLLAEKKVETDEEAFLLLYGEGGSRNSYHKLKHQLKDRLFNTAFFVDAKQAKFSSRRQAYIECQFLICLASTLYALRAKSNTVDICKKILSIGSKFDFTSERIIAATKLMNYYKVSGRLKECNQLIELIFALTELQRKENHAMLYWTKISIKFLKDRAPKQEIAKEAAGYIEEIDKIASPLSSQNLDFSTAALAMSAHMSVGNYHKAALILHPALEKISSYTFVDPGYFHGLAINLVACYIPLKRYSDGEDVLSRIYGQVKVGTFNWFKAREMHFILLLHTKRYKEAFTLHQDTVARKKYNKLPPYLREIWTIYNAYLRILGNAGKIPLTEQQQITPFRISRYLNSLPTFSKDKRGQNVPVIISQILLLLQQNKLDEIDDRFEAVGKYRSRYAGVEKNFRGNVFLHMLQQVIKRNFDRVKIEKATAELRPLLDTVMIDITSQGYDQEILPYEDLWEIIIDAL